MDTAARWAAPGSPMWLLDSERKSSARFKRRPWETESQRSWGGHINGGYGVCPGSYTCAICAAPASPIELNAKLSNRRFLLADVVVERADPIRRAPSSPIRLFRRDKWVMLDQRDTRHESGMFVLLWMQIWTSSGLLCEIWNLLGGLTRCLQRGEGGSSALVEGCPPMSQH